VLAKLDGGLNTTQHVGSVCKNPPGSNVVRQLVPGVAVGVIIADHGVADGLEVTC